LNALTTRAAIETVVGFQWPEGELILLCRDATPHDLRIELSRLYGAIRSRASATPARAADPVDQLERLAKLLEQGLLSREQFDAAKAKLIEGL
jgi:Short C-terminal domain